MIVTEENGGIGRKACHSAIYSTTNVTWPSLGSKPCVSELWHGQVRHTQGVLEQGDLLSIWT
jgi:hypothetical protein